MPGEINLEFKRLSSNWNKKASVSLIFSIGRQLHLKSKKERGKGKKDAEEEEGGEQKKERAEIERKRERK